MISATADSPSCSTQDELAGRERQQSGTAPDEGEGSSRCESRRKERKTNVHDARLRKSARRCSSGNITKQRDPAVRRNKAEVGLLEVAGKEGSQCTAPIFTTAPPSQIGRDGHTN